MFLMKLAAGAASGLPAGWLGLLTVKPLFGIAIF
jgi:hypothetical protein